MALTFPFGYITPGLQNAVRLSNLAPTWQKGALFPLASFLAPLTGPPNPPHPLWRSLHSTHGKVPAPAGRCATFFGSHTSLDRRRPGQPPARPPALAHQPLGISPAVLRHFRAIQLSVAHHPPTNARIITPARAWHTPPAGNHRCRATQWLWRPRPQRPTSEPTAEPIRPHASNSPPTSPPTTMTTPHAS